MTKKQIRAELANILLATSPHGLSIPMGMDKKQFIKRLQEETQEEALLDRLRVTVKYMALEIESSRRELLIIINRLGEQ
jgi:hypothetical protein